MIMKNKEEANYQKMHEDSDREDRESMENKRNNQKNILDNTRLTFVTNYNRKESINISEEN